MGTLSPSMVSFPINIISFYANTYITFPWVNSKGLICSKKAINVMSPIIRQITVRETVHFNFLSQMIDFKVLFFTIFIVLFYCFLCVFMFVVFRVLKSIVRGSCVLRYQLISIILLFIWWYSGYCLISYQRYINKIVTLVRWDFSM